MKEYVFHISYAVMSSQQTQRILEIYRTLDHKHPTTTDIKAWKEFIASAFNKATTISIITWNLMRK